MRASIEKRLSDLEDGGTDWISKLEFVDYDSGIDYEDDTTWEELHFDETITVVRNRETNEVRGYYYDRRTLEEIVAAGGNLAFL